MDNEAWFVLQQCCWIGLLDRFWARFPRLNFAYTLPILRLWYQRQFRFWFAPLRSQAVRWYSGGFWALPSVTLLHLGKTSELALHSTSVTFPSEDDGKNLARCRQGLGKVQPYSSHTQTSLLSMATLCHHYANAMRSAGEGYGINCRIRLTRRTPRTPKEHQRRGKGGPKEDVSSISNNTEFFPKLFFFVDFGKNSAVPQCIFQIG